MGGIRPRLCLVSATLSEAGHLIPSTYLALHAVITSADIPIAVGTIARLPMGHHVPGIPVSMAAAGSLHGRNHLHLRSRPHNTWQ